MLSDHLAQGMCWPDGLQASGHRSDGSGWHADTGAVVHSTMSVIRQKTSPWESGRKKARIAKSDRLTVLPLNFSAVQSFRAVFAGLLPPRSAAVIFFAAAPSQPVREKISKYTVKNSSSPYRVSACSYQKNSIISVLAFGPSGRTPGWAACRQSWPCGCSGQKMQ